MQKCDDLFGLVKVTTMSARPAILVAANHACLFRRLLPKLSNENTYKDDPTHLLSQKLLVPGIAQFLIFSNGPSNANESCGNDIIFASDVDTPLKELTTI
jgi:hypothetical protein